MRLLIAIVAHYFTYPGLTHRGGEVEIPRERELVIPRPSFSHVDFVANGGFICPMNDVVTGASSFMSRTHPLIL